MLPVLRSKAIFFNICKLGGNIQPGKVCMGLYEGEIGQFLLFQSKTILLIRKNNPKCAHLRMVPNNYQQPPPPSNFLLLKCHINIRGPCKAIIGDVRHLTTSNFGMASLF